MNPSAGSAGVEGVLVVMIWPVSSSTRTTSVNVPPVSTPMRTLGIFRVYRSAPTRRTGALCRIKSAPSSDPATEDLRASGSRPGIAPGNASGKPRRRLFRENTHGRTARVAHAHRRRRAGGPAGTAAERARPTPARGRPTGPRPRPAQASAAPRAAEEPADDGAAERHGRPEAERGDQ